MFGVKLRMTLVLYALSLLFLMRMFAAILSVFPLTSILEVDKTPAGKSRCDTWIFPPESSDALVYCWNLNLSFSFFFFAQTEEINLPSTVTWIDPTFSLILFEEEPTVLRWSLLWQTGQQYTSRRSHILLRESIKQEKQMFNTTAQLIQTFSNRWYG